MEPLAFTLFVTVENEHWNICRYIYEVVSAIGFSLCSVSLWTLTAISLDRVLALLLGLRYRQVVTLKRVYLIIITIWIMSIVSALATYLFWNSPTWWWFGTIAASLGVAISTFSHTKIFFTLRRHQHQVQDHVQQPNQANQMNIGRYRKAVSTALWLQFTLLGCYLPYVIVTILQAQTELSSSVSALAMAYSLTLVFLNSSLNPILYCWKIEEVRQAIKDAIKQVLCC